MFKLIVTDMDGSLLNNNKELPIDIFEVIQHCENQGIEFAIGSGRSYQTLSTMFSSVKDKISFICDNGAYVVSKNKVLFSSPIPKDKVDFFIKEGRKDPHVYTVLCTPTLSYFENSERIDSQSMEEILHYYPNCQNVDDLLEVDADVLKICYLDPRGAENYIYQQLKPFNGNPRVVHSAHVWVDIVNAEVNKGIGIEKLQEEFNLTHAETVIFGDYLNDLEMFQQASTSFAPINAHDDIKKLATEIIGSNDEWSVVNKIKELVNY
ncbi:HAD family hydrolase [Anaerorhabdus sp.]|uniref:HAD family hydrolase n=2 Tax=Anaerorhabdus sp. TaxID=1872524 RepID=UPI002B20B726|nr:HAD family hydrolase [Anaerorhabdus sp.]MEA4874741.1 HAD family hydrolase [Anaerorhabdus sp.]